LTRLFGNLRGLAPSQTKALEKLATRRTDRQRLIGVDLARELGELSWETGRSVGVLLDRAGHVTRVLVGDTAGVPLPDVGKPPQPGRLAGLRLVRTELRRDTRIGDADRALLVRYRMDALCRLVVDEVGEVLWVLHAFLDPARMEADDDHRLVSERNRRRLTALPGDFLEEIEALEEEIRRRAIGLHTVAEGERALLVGIHVGDLDDARVRMAELVELARSGSYDVVAHTFQKRIRPDPRTLIGRGKVQEVARLAVKYCAHSVVVDRELSGIQQRNLEERLGLEVIDRTDLVLRIFERRAGTRQAKLRVALARMRYQLPRLAMREHGLSRIGRAGVAGVGTRGKGERRIDLERRRMRDKIHRLEFLLQRVARQQATRRRQRERSGIPICSLVGYANAGKSSWLNALTEANVTSEDLLFATLDTTVRRTRLPGGRDVLFADTVGFLRELPEPLVDAFRSTLEELTRSVLLIHVVDVAAHDWEAKQAAVLETLAMLGATGIPRLTLYNKADLVDRTAFVPLVAATGGELVSVMDGEDRYAVRSFVEDRLRS
jgi:GTP-binding protein HflX